MDFEWSCYLYFWTQKWSRYPLSPVRSLATIFWHKHGCPLSLGFSRLTVRDFPWCLTYVSRQKSAPLLQWLSFPVKNQLIFLELIEFSRQKSAPIRLLLRRGHIFFLFSRLGMALINTFMGLARSHFFSFLRLSQLVRLTRLFRWIKKKWQRPIYFKHLLISSSKFKVKVFKSKRKNQLMADLFCFSCKGICPTENTYQ